MEGPEEGKEFAQRRHRHSPDHRSHLPSSSFQSFVPVVPPPPPPPFPVSSLPTGAALATFVIGNQEPILRLRKTTRKSSEKSPSKTKSNAVSAVYSQVLTNYDHADEEKFSSSRKRRRDDDDDGGARGGDILDGGLRTEEEEGGGDDGGEGGARVDPPARERPAVSFVCGNEVSVSSFFFLYFFPISHHPSINLLPAQSLTLARTLISD